MARIKYMLICGLMVLLAACEKDTEPTNFAPGLTTGNATDIYRKGATLSGSIHFSGTSTAQSYGILFSELQSMAEFTEHPIKDGSHEFSIDMQNLTPNTTYYYCTYASSGFSLAKGDVKNFTTTESNAPVFAEVTLNQKDVQSCGVSTTVIDDGGSELIMGGFCWSMASEGEPTIESEVQNTSVKNGSLSATIKGLLPETEYYVRAYAVNADGIGYSKSLVLTTDEATAPVLSNITPKDSTDFSVTVEAQVVSSGTSAISKAGFCWSVTNELPTVDDSSNDVTSQLTNENAVLSSTLANLSPNTTYYIRAYATNEQGTSYSEVFAFKTAGAEIAYLCQGSVFNERVKQLANSKIMTCLDTDSIIRQIEFKTGVEAHLSDSYVKVSADDSQTSIYASFNATDGLLSVYTASNVIEIVNAGYLFTGLSVLDTIDFGNFQINGTTNDMMYMFSNCKSLTSLDVSNWNTSNVTNMEGVFDVCSSLRCLDVSRWDTSNVTTMRFMFWGCEALTSLDVSGWDLSNVTNLDSVFGCCFSLVKLDVSAWNTSNVVDMASVFYQCMSLEALDVSNWDTSKATNMGHLFTRCVALGSLDISGWDTSNVTNMYWMFADCCFTSLDLSQWDTSNVTDMSHMFEGCEELAKLDIFNWSLQEDIECSEMFVGCASISKSCEITASQATQNTLTGLAESTGMEMSYFTWVTGE